jgi:hypothetical protein
MLGGGEQGVAPTLWNYRVLLMFRFDAPLTEYVTVRGARVLLACSVELAEN